MTSEERKDVIRYLPNFWHSLVQAIIQSRDVGEQPKCQAKKTTMFNLELLVYEDITREMKSFIGNQVLAPGNPFSIEFQLHTADGNNMVLEIWTLSIEENYESSSQNLCQVTDRMSLLLKSAICVSRITPAYQLSFRQDPTSYVIMYKIFAGKPSYAALGENPNKVRIGQTNLQSHNLSLHLAYRTVLTFPIQFQSKGTLDQMMVKSDHFKADSSPKHYRRISDRVTDSSDTGPSDESQDASRWPFMSPMDLQHSSPRSRTSSESSNRGLFSTLSSEKIYVPFAKEKPPSLEEFFLPDETPYNNILESTIEKLENLECEKEREAKERKLSESESEGKPPKEAKVAEKAQMNSSDHSTKSFSSNATKEDEYVVVDMKTPFADTSTNDLELSTYFKEWQAAPPLKSFCEEEEDVDTTSSDILSEAIQKYEDCVGEYDELVKSFHVEDLTGSQELG